MHHFAIAPKSTSRRSYPELTAPAARVAPAALVVAAARVAPAALVAAAPVAA